MKDTAEMLLKKVNLIRMAYNRGKLQPEEYLESLALLHATFMATNGEMQHSNHRFTEVVAWTRGRIGAVDIWMDSVPHKTILLRPDLNFAGFGRVDNEGISYYC